MITCIVLLLSAIGIANASETADTLACIDTVAVDTISYVPMVEQPRTLYDLPYSRTTRMENWRRLAQNTTIFALAGVATLYVLQALPDDATAWNKKELRRMGLFSKWRYHANHGPVWDKDNPVFNYVMHPYGGAVYYMSARTCGFNVLGSLAYSTFVSAVLWEYGIECFNEVPSVQDLVITPLAGMVVGECFYRIKRAIVNNNYHLFSSWFLGHLVAWIVDPINEFVSLFAGNPCKNRHVTMTPVTLTGPNSSLGLALNLTF